MGRIRTFVVHRRAAALRLAIAVSVLVPATSHAQLPQAPESVSSLFDRAAGLYKNADLGEADTICTQALKMLPPVAAATAAQRADWMVGLELRARVRFKNDDLGGAKKDFAALFEINPDYEGGLTNAKLGADFPSDISDTLNQVRKATVGTLRIAVNPADAIITINTVPVTTGSPVITKQLFAGRPYLVIASRPGFAEQRYSFPIAPDTVTEGQVDLVRVSAVLFVKTVPSGVEILLNNISQGVTKPSGDRDGESEVFAIAPIEIGKPELVFRKNCFVSDPRIVPVNEPRDYELPAPVRLIAAVGRVIVTGAGRVSIDGEEKSEAPFTSDSLCEGPHSVDVRTKDGLFTTVVQIEPGKDHTVESVIRPAVAILSAVNLPPGFPRDLRREVQLLLQQSAGLTLVVPSEADANTAVRQRNLLPGWTEAAFFRELRETGSRDLAGQFLVQAVAEVSAISPQDSRNLRFTLLAAGSVRPDVISLNLADPESMAAAVKALGAAPALMDLSTGIQLVDARDVRGAVVVRSRVEIGLLPGDVIVAADKTEVGDTADFESYVARTRPGATLVLEVKRRGVSTAPIQVRVVSTPRVVGFYDKSLLANKLLLQFRLLAGEAADPDQQAAARLNLAVALMVLGRWDEAETELRQVSLPDGPGVSKGTVKYLLGLCLDELKRVPEANEAYGEAMLVREALLTTDGPLIRGLAEAKLRDKTRRNP